MDAQTPNKGGRLLVGSAGGGAKDKLDPHAPDSNPDIARVFALYEPLAERNQNYEFKLVLAEEITGNAIADVWTVRLRQGVEFQNGKTLTSDDAIASVQRMIDPKRSSASSSLADIDPNGFKKLDDRTFSIQLKQPYGTFDVQLGQYIAQGSVRIEGEELLRLCRKHCARSAASPSPTCRSIRAPRSTRRSAWASGSRRCCSCTTAAEETP